MVLNGFNSNLYGLKFNLDDAKLGKMDPDGSKRVSKRLQHTSIGGAFGPGFPGGFCGVFCCCWVLGAVGGCWPHLCVLTPFFPLVFGFLVVFGVLWLTGVARLLYQLVVGARGCVSGWVCEWLWLWLWVFSRFACSPVSEVWLPERWLV